jgi:hypothetical protein
MRKQLVYLLLEVFSGGLIAGLIMRSFFEALSLVFIVIGILDIGMLLGISFFFPIPRYVQKQITVVMLVWLVGGPLGVLCGWVFRASYSIFGLLGPLALGIIVVVLSVMAVRRFLS